jgi:hypothetical protein
MVAERNDDEQVAAAPGRTPKTVLIKIFRFAAGEGGLPKAAMPGSGVPLVARSSSAEHHYLQSSKLGLISVNVRCA